MRTLLQIINRAIEPYLSTMHKPNASKLVSLADLPWLLLNPCLELSYQQKSMGIDAGSGSTVVETCTILYLVLCCRRRVRRDGVGPIPFIRFQCPNC